MSRYPPTAAAAFLLDRPYRRSVPVVEDRGLQFADGVYEVVKCVDGRLCDLERHLDRLDRSLAALTIPWPVSAARAWRGIIREAAAAQSPARRAVYLQIDRGVAPRNHCSPSTPGRR